MKNQERGVTLGLLIITIISMCIILILAMLKIYLSNQIYHQSRNINILEAEVAALKEENNILHMKVEKLRYKGEISDTIFSIESDQGDNTAPVNSKRQP